MHRDESVEWELEQLERADVVAMYLDPATKAPVSLLELGLFARSGRVVVGCPPAFYRRGNVEIVCARYGAALTDTLDDMLDAVIARLTGTKV